MIDFSNIEFEKMALCQIMIEPKVLDDYYWTADFFTPPNKKIFEEIIKLIDEGIKPDIYRNS